MEPLVYVAAWTADRDEAAVGPERSIQIRQRLFVAVRKCSSSWEKTRLVAAAPECDQAVNAEDPAHEESVTRGAISFVMDGRLVATGE